MNHHVRRRNDTFIRMKAHRLEFSADYPAASVEAAQMDVIEEVLEEIEQNAANQVGNFGEARFEYNSKEIARENLREDIIDIRDMAGSMAYEFPGIDELFHVRKNITDAEMLALGRAFHERSAEYENDFKRYGLKASFRAALQAAIDAFEESLTPPEMALESQVQATAQLGESVRRGMIARRILMGVMKIKYKNNPAKYRAWLTASHIERDSEKKDAAPTP